MRSIAALAALVAALTACSSEAPLASATQTPQPPVVDLCDVSDPLSLPPLTRADIAETADPRLRACVEGESGTVDLSAEWLALIATDGTTLPAEVTLDSGSPTPADCDLDEDETFAIEVSGQLYHARSVRCAQNG